MRQSTARANERLFKLRIDADGHCICNEAQIAVSQSKSQGVTRVQLDDQYVTVYCEMLPAGDYDVWIKHHVIHVSLEDEKDRLLKKLGNANASQATAKVVAAPMPGMVTDIKVRVGDTVEAGKGLLTLEAMKMENEIRSPIHGKIVGITASQGSAVEKGQALVIIESMELLKKK